MSPAVRRGVRKEAEPKPPREGAETGPPSEHWPEEPLDPEDERLLQRHPRVGGRYVWVSLNTRRAALMQASDAIYAVLVAFFETEAKRLARVIRRQPRMPSPEEIQRAVDQAIAEYDWAPWQNVLRPQLRKPIEEAFRRGARDMWEAIEKAGISLTWDTLPAEAVAYAERRAAEMVGMHVLPDGTAVPSQDARLRIDETTRARMRRDITRWLQEGQGWSDIARMIEGRQYTGFFPDWRARRIARTEASFAYNNGNIEACRQAGLTQVRVIDGTQDGICAPVNGQIWTLAEAQANPLGHPHCSRTFVAVLPETPELARR